MPQSASFILQCGLIFFVLIIFSKAIMVLVHKIWTVQLTKQIKDRNILPRPGKQKKKFDDQN